MQVFQFDRAGQEAMQRACLSKHRIDGGELARGVRVIRKAALRGTSVRLCMMAAGSVIVIESMGSDPKAMTLRTLAWAGDLAPLAHVSIAKELFLSAVGDLPDRGVITVEVYGPQGEGDCLVGFRPGDAEAFPVAVGTVVDDPSDKLHSLARELSVKQG